MAVSPRRGPLRGPTKTRRRLIGPAAVDGTPSGIGSGDILFSATNNIVVFGKSLLYPSIQEPTPLTITTDVTFGWLTPLSEPVRSRKFGAHLQRTTEVEDRDPAVPFSYYQNWSVPQRQRDGLRTAAQDAAIDSNFTPVTVTFTNFGFAPFSEPVRVKQFRATYQDAFIEPNWPISFVGTGDVLFTTTDCLVTYTQSLQYPSIQEPVPLDITTAVTFGWLTPFNEPVRTSKFGTHLQMPQPVRGRNPVVPFSYYNWLSEPVRIKPGLSAQFQRVTEITDTDPIVSFSYYNWLSEPQRQKVGLKIHLQSTVTSDPQAEFRISFGYYNPLSEPKREKVGLKTHLQSIGAVSDPKPEFPISYGYYNPLSDPTRRVGIKTHLQSTTTFDPQREFPINVSSWWQNFTDPVRKYGLRAGSQRADWWSNFTPTPPTDLGYISWWNNFSEPTRRRGFRTEEQQSFASPHLQPTVTFGYYSPLSEPVRQKRGLSYTLQPVTVIPARQPNVTFGFYGWLSEPQRSRRLSVAQQQAIVTTLYPIIPPVVITRGWFNWLDDPKRKRPGLSVTLQQAFTMPPRVIVGGNVTGIINAYQLNTDTAEISVFVRNYNVPTHAIVSVEEIANGYNVANPHYLTSIQEVVIDEGRGVTSVIESPASNLATGPVFQANVFQNNVFQVAASNTFKPARAIVSIEEEEE